MFTTLIQPSDSDDSRTDLQGGPSGVLLHGGGIRKTIISGLGFHLQEAAGFL